MDHSTMDHSHMDHGAPSPAMCSMNMLFTWDTTNLCIVFRWWHIQSTFSLMVSLLAVVALTMGYEALRESSRRYERWVARDAELPRRNSQEVSKRAHMTKALFYAFQTFYAFMLMLVFMTYNGWVMVAVALGAFLGYLFFGTTTSATKDNACH